MLYGTTTLGGISNEGSVFSLTPPVPPSSSWTVNFLHTFTGGGGALPYDAVAIGRDGILYGTTYAGNGGGTSNAGTVFSLKP